ncbi:MAG: SsrA-binding protein [Candidatus Shikimatogenerans sp. Tser]|uniref:SsrA-binding protein n=1 Tax=Candidatus Shikimatogenerans sp. Tser TaxID=3158568 RepID=A0AAU7QSC2_9FLAO
MKNIIIIKNKKIKIQYKMLKKFIAGLVLIKDEIKNIRNKNLNINNSYCIIQNNEIFINNINFIHYKCNNKYYKRRNIKLLLNKFEILKISKQIKIYNYSIIPYKIFLKNNILAKIVIYICKSLKKYDKRFLLKEKEFKNYNYKYDL